MPNGNADTAAQRVYGTMSAGLDYSRFDSIGDESSGDEDGDKILRGKAWDPMEQLKLMADTQYADDANVTHNKDHKRVHIRGTCTGGWQ